MKMAERFGDSLRSYAENASSMYYSYPMANLLAKEAHWYPFYQDWH
jgi:hypothetical protein